MAHNIAYKSLFVSLSHTNTYKHKNTITHIFWFFIFLSCVCMKLCKESVVIDIPCLSLFVSASTMLYIIQIDVFVLFYNTKKQLWYILILIFSYQLKYAISLTVLIYMDICIYIQNSPIWFSNVSKKSWLKVHKTQHCCLCFYSNQRQEENLRRA